MRVCFVVGGENTNVFCGVRDYSLRLAAALAEDGIYAQVMAASQWDWQTSLAFCRRVREGAFDIVHVQYPAIGFKWSLAPHLLGFMKVGKKLIVTLHEHSSLPRAQRCASYMFAATADCILFTDTSEKKRFQRPYKFLAPHFEVIPIGSNVLPHNEIVPRANRLIYFGQIKPDKGIENFLAITGESTFSRGDPVLTLMGSVPPRHHAYYLTLRADYPAVEWLIDLPSEKIAEILAGSLAAYLPFPDGASYKRGSLLAALANGLPVIAPIGSATPPELASTLLPATGPAEALEVARELLRSPARAAAISASSRVFAQRFSWPEIARKHQTTYKHLLT